MPNSVHFVDEIFGQARSSKPLKVLLVSPEVSPYANVAGLSRVVGYLSRTLAKKGLDVRVFMPKFGSIDEESYPMEMVIEGLKVPTGDEGNPYLVCNVKKHQAKGFAPVYFLENREYYELRANVYGYNDDHIRWALLSRGVLEFLKQSDWVPDVIHANDWETGLVINWLKTSYQKEEKFLKMATVFTIHNLIYQGIFDHKNMSDLNFDDGKSEIVSFFNDRLYWQNFLRRGIMYGDIITTVSKNYAREILRPEFGEGLDRLLAERRSHLFGVLNGIDCDEYNPRTDRLLAQNYDENSLSRRRENKIALQEEFDLPQDPKIPVISSLGRMTDQKGLDLLFDVLPPLLRDFEVQFIIVGGGEGKYLDFFRWLAQQFPKKVGVHLMMDYTLPHLVFSGSDLMVFPSRWEPCGLVQIEGMRYGALPIAREIGGLADTVKNFDPEKDEGWGFTFKDFDKWALFAQIVRALEIYRHKSLWEQLQKRAMQQDWSWDARSDEYVTLYRKAIHLRQEELINEGKLERTAE